MSCSQFAKVISQHTHDGMLLFDAERTIRYANTSFYAMTGFTQERVIGGNLNDLFLDTLRHDSFPACSHDPKKETPWKGTLSYTGEDGRIEKLPVVILNCEHEAGSTDTYLAIFAPQNLTAGTTHDPLTGLAGSELFFDRLQQALIASRRDKSKIAVLLINLDRLSLINDGLGHEIGDCVIKEIAGRLARSFRESDTLARIVADSFALLIKITADDHAALVAEKVLQSIRQPIVAEGQTVVITASMGIVITQDSDVRASDILGNAESALNRAKVMGGNRYQYFSKELNETAKKRVEIENSLRAAISSEEFLLFYQPKVDIRTSNIIGMEALIRWEHPQRGLVAPFHFIPVAEETGMIIEIGRWVLNEACRQNKAWQQEGLPSLPIAVNVSARQFQYPGFVGDVKNAVENSGIAPKYLELEITENMLMSDIEQTIRKLTELSEVGLTMAIDDFGTGYSNLSYLVRFPVTTLKIDRAFIKDVDSDDTIAALTRSIIKMSQNLKLKVVAEGAESIKHIAFLKEHRCNVVQGYYYSKPLNAADFGKLLKKGFSLDRL